MKVQVTTLCENTATEGYVIAEFGWSVFIETEELNILFDTGKSISVCHNADVLGVDLRKIDEIVLSHSHPDHTGGLRQVLNKMRKEVDIIGHPHIWAIKYNRRENKNRFMGIPFARQEIENLGATFHLTTEPYRISENIMTTGEIPMVTEFEDIAAPIGGGNSRLIQEGPSLKPDGIMDDRALVINTRRGLVVILGCSHRGIINTLSHAQQIAGVDRIFAVICGAHLLTVSQERIGRTITALKKFGVQKLGLCHCTGQEAAARMAAEFGDSFFYNHAGIRTELA